MSSDRWVPLRATDNEWHQHLNVWVVMFVQGLAGVIIATMKEVWWIAPGFTFVIGLSVGMGTMLWAGGGRHDERRPS